MGIEISAFTKGLQVTHSKSVNPTLSFFLSFLCFLLLIHFPFSVDGHSQKLSMLWCIYAVFLFPSLMSHWTHFLAAALVFFLSGCADLPEPEKTEASASEQRILVSVEEQRMVLFEKGVAFAVFAISTSRTGIGDEPNSLRTPLGHLDVAEVIGKGLPSGTILDARKSTGRIAPVNAPGGDPIVTRIVRLRGREAQNVNAYRRCIYIHGTPDEKHMKTPASQGCVRMKSSHIIRLCDWVKAGARVDIVPGRLPAPDKLPP